MAEFVFVNFFATQLAAAVAPGDTTITVASASGAPTLSAGQQWVLVIQSAATPSAREVVYVTAISGTAFTVTRGREGTTAGTWAIADNVQGNNTAGGMAAMGQLAGSNTWSGTNNFSNTVEILNGAGTNQPVALGQFTTNASGSGYSQSSGHLTIPAVLNGSPTTVIVRWGPVAGVSAGSSLVVNYDTAFSTALLAVVPVAGATAVGDPPLSGMDVTASPLTNFTVRNSSTTAPTQPGLYIAIGY